MPLPEKISVRKIDRNIAKAMIEEHHYTHTFTSCTYALGIFYKEESGNDFFGTDENLIGCLIYGHPVGRFATKSISKNLEFHQILELTRLFVFDEYGKNVESCAIGKSFEWLRKNVSEIEMLVSYSDPAQNHLGYIYQATNWIYQGNKFSIMDRYSVSLTKDPYDWIHHRTVFEKWNTVGLEELKRKIGKTFWIRVEPDKHRYVYPLKKRKYWLKQMHYPSLPYPKSQKWEYEIQEVTC